MKHLESLNDLDDAIAQSSEKPVFLFKHSTRCPVSVAADQEYLTFVDDHADNADVIFTHLDLLQHRDVSDAITERLSVQHQSPQAILVIDGEAKWHKSHGNINQASLTAALTADADA